MKITKKQLGRLIESQVKQIQEGRKKVAKILGAIQLLSPEDKALLFNQLGNVGNASSGNAPNPSNAPSGEVDPNSLTGHLREILGDGFELQAFRNELTRIQQQVANNKKAKETIIKLWWKAEELEDLLEDEYGEEDDNVIEVTEEMESLIDYIDHWIREGAVK